MDSRQAFEAWASDNVSHPTFGGKYVRDGAWSYNHNFMDAHWRCWQEATERAAKVCEDARDNIWEYHESVVKRTAQDVCENLAAAIRAAAPPQCTSAPSEPQ